MKDFWPLLFAVVLLIGSVWPDAPVPNPVDPVPVPVPVPVPTPVVVEKVERPYITIIRETAGLTPDDAAKYRAIRNGLRDVDCELNFSDPDDPIVATNGYAEKVPGFPAVVVQTRDTNKTLLAQRITGTAEDVLAAVRKVIGQ